MQRLECADRARSRSAHARTARLLVAVLASVTSPANADDAGDPRIVMIPRDCLQFWSAAPSNRTSPRAWDTVLSFAACIQNSETAEVRHSDELQPLVDQLQLDLEPALRFYEVALAEGPQPIQLRAAYYVGLGQVALLTRARKAVVSPALRPELERILEPHATVAYLVFTAITRVAAADPTLTQDVVIRNMVRSSGELAAALRTTISLPEETDTPIAASRQ